jgi:hypothetical protein
MVPFMLIDAPDDRYRGGDPRPPWRRTLRLLAAALACFLVAALVPFGGFLLEAAAAAFLLVTLSMLD